MTASHCRPTTLRNAWTPTWNSKKNWTRLGVFGKWWRLDCTTERWSASWRAQRYRNDCFARDNACRKALNVSNANTCCVVKQCSARFGLTFELAHVSSMRPSRTTAYEPSNTKPSHCVIAVNSGPAVVRVKCTITFTSTATSWSNRGSGHSFPRLFDGSGGLQQNERPT